MTQDILLQIPAPSYVMDVYKTAMLDKDTLNKLAHIRQNPVILQQGPDAVADFMRRWASEVLQEAVSVGVLKAYEPSDVILISLLGQCALIVEMPIREPGV